MASKRISDTQRLDWLQANPWNLEDCCDIVSMGKGKDDPIGFAFGDTPVFESIRQAIDAAIRAERKSRGK